MLDLSFVRDNLPLVEEKLRQRGMDPGEVEDFRAIDTERRQAITETETMKARRNRASEEIAPLKKSGQDASALIAETKELREKIQEREKLVAEYEDRLQQLLAGIPNLPHQSVPVGKSADDNVEVRQWGSQPTFDFTPKPHWELGEQLGVLDMERATKLTGARFAVYWDLGARLERALANFMLDLHTREHGYTEVLTVPRNLDLLPGAVHRIRIYEERWQHLGVSMLARVEIEHEVGESTFETSA